MAENLRTYETICLTKVDMPVDKFNSLVERVTNVIVKESKGEVLMQDDWGKAKIAYPIQREPRAQWTYFRYQAAPGVVEEVTRQLKINEFVLRQMTSTCAADEGDYKTLRATFPKDLSERFSFRDDRPRRRKPTGRDGGGRRPRFDERDGDVVRPAAPATPRATSSDDQSSSGSES